MKPLDPAWLRTEYLERRTPLARMAELAGVSERTIRNQLRSAGIGRRPRQERQPAPPRSSRYALLNDADALASRIAQGATLYKLAQEAGCDRRAVRCALVRHGIAYERERAPYSTQRRARAT